MEAFWVYVDSVADDGEYSKENDKKYLETLEEINNNIQEAYEALEVLENPVTEKHTL